MQSQHSIVVAALANAILAQPAVAADTPGLTAEDSPQFGFTPEADLEFGGDDFATVSFEDGDSQDISLGQGLTLALGGQYKPAEFSPFAVRATVGYKFVTTSATNADIGITRIVYEVVGSYRLASDFWF